MKKKLIIASLIIAATSTASIAANYVGGSIGATDLSVYRNTHVKSGGIGKVFVGSGGTLGKHNNLYLGTELNGDLARYTREGQTSYGLGASVIPGVLINDNVMLYGRVGLEANRDSRNSTTHVGNQLGVGVQTCLSQDWDARAEYVQTSALGGHSQVNVGLLYKF